MYNRFQNKKKNNNNFCDHKSINTISKHIQTKIIMYHTYIYVHFKLQIDDFVIK